MMKTYFVHLALIRCLAIYSWPISLFSRKGAIQKLRQAPRGRGDLSVTQCDTGVGMVTVLLRHAAC